MDPDHALQLLSDGNQRFVDGASRHPHQDPAHRQQVASGQQPWAMVLSCADSRVTPELIFDVGLGDLFVVRVAGNVATPGVIGSLELAVSEFGCPLLVVLGHHGCGCAQAAVERGPVQPGKVSELTRRMAVGLTNLDTLGADAVNKLVLHNVRYQVVTLRRTPPILSTAVTDGRLRIVGAVYELASGRTGFLEDDATATTGK